MCKNEKQENINSKVRRKPQVKVHKYRGKICVRAAKNDKQVYQA
jgi:hypothetical protein